MSHYIDQLPPGDGEKNPPGVARCFTRLLHQPQWSEGRIPQGVGWIGVLLGCSITPGGGEKDLPLDEDGKVSHEVDQSPPKGGGMIPPGFGG